MEITWNLTNCCGFSCKICIANAITVNHKNKEIIEMDLQKNKKSLNFEDKTKILKDIAAVSPSAKLDFTGGDPLLFKENLAIIEKASKLFGPQNIEISTTGYCLDDKMIGFLKNKIVAVDLTLDTIFPRLESSRGKVLSRVNIKAIKLAAKKKLPVIVSTVLKKDNIDRENLREIYDFLIANNVAKWFLLRYRPHNRVGKNNSLAPTEKEYKDALKLCLSFKKNSNLKIDIHHTFYSLMGVNGAEEACKAGNKIFILSDGSVITCCWALNRFGKPLDDLFTLGKLPESSFREIIESKKIKKLQKIPACRVDYFFENKLPSKKSGDYD